MNERDSVEEGEIFTWPKKLEHWDASDVEPVVGEQASSASAPSR